MMRNYRGGHGYMRGSASMEGNCCQPKKPNMGQCAPQNQQQRQYPPMGEPVPPIAPPPPENFPVPPIEEAPPMPPPRPHPVPPAPNPPPRPHPVPPCQCPPMKPCPPPTQPPCPPQTICPKEPTCREKMKYTPIEQQKLAPNCGAMKESITDNLGKPTQNDNHTLTVAPNGAALLKDTYLIEKLAHFDRERIPERVVHANGTGAFGCFKTTNSMSDYTVADIFSKADKITPAFVRFSTVVGSKGSADTVRDPRGFAVKLYTEEGNLDIVGNNLPVFFVRDAIKFPDLIHSLKPAPDTGVKDPVRFWDFYSQTPEATHMITWVYSDRGTVKSFRKMNGFGVNTFCWVNAEGKRFLVKYHFISKQGIETIDRKEAERLAGIDPDIAKDDLYETLQGGNTVDFDLCVQILPICEAESLPFDPLDDTKTWPEDRLPLKKVGTLTLSRNFENQFTQVEQAAFCPANLVPGIEFSDDKMLAGRGFSYSDTQRYRIGANFAELPINSPRATVENFQQDGEMRLRYRRSTVNYSPSSCTLCTNVPVQKPEKPPFTAQYSQGTQIRSAILKQDNFTQAGERFRGMTATEQAHLVDNIACELCYADDYITEKCLEYFTAACPKWAEMQAARIEEYREIMA